jgi:hypothetical protein
MRKAAAGLLRPNPVSRPFHVLAALTGLAAAVHPFATSLAQTLPDEKKLQESLANKPVEQALKIPADICRMVLTIEYPDQPSGSIVPKERTFCDYAASLLAASATPPELRTWEVNTQPVPVIGFVVNVRILLRYGQVACTFKNFAGKLVFAGTWFRDERTGRTEFDAASARYDLLWCLNATHYYEGESRRGILPAVSR